MDLNTVPTWGCCLFKGQTSNLDCPPKLVTIPAHHKTSPSHRKSGEMRSGHEASPLWWVTNNNTRSGCLIRPVAVCEPWSALPLLPFHHFPYPALCGFLHPSLTLLPHNLPLPPFPLAFSTFSVSLHAPLHFNDLLDIARTRHVVLVS